MWAGCYTLDLYCDNATEYPDQRHAFREFPHQYSHEHGSACRAKARKAGWTINRDGTAYCPKCGGKKAPTDGVPVDVKTGWPSPELMQDDDRGLSRALADPLAESLRRKPVSIKAAPAGVTGGQHQVPCRTDADGSSLDAIPQEPK